jgi:hypothetical protein
MTTLEWMPIWTFKEVNQKEKLLNVWNISYTAIMFLTADSDRRVLKLRSVIVLPYTRCSKYTSLICQVGLRILLKYPRTVIQCSYLAMSCTATTLELPVLHERVKLQQHCCENIRFSKAIQCSMQEFIYSAVCLTKNPQGLPERVL